MVPTYLGICRTRYVGNGRDELEVKLSFPVVLDDDHVPGLHNWGTSYFACSHMLSIMEAEMHSYRDDMREYLSRYSH